MKFLPNVSNWANNLQENSKYKKKKGTDDVGGIVTSSECILNDITSNFLRSNCIYRTIIMTVHFSIFTTKIVFVPF